MALTKVIGAGAEGLTLSSTSLTVANGLTLTDGDVTLASGHGIDFGSTADSSGTKSNEILSDYEEGSCTFTYTGSSGNPTVTYDGVTYGYYTKIGRKVLIEGRVRTDAFSGGGGVLQVSGLPYIVSNIDPDKYVTGGGIVSNDFGSNNPHSTMAIAGTTSFYCIYGNYNVNNISDCQNGTNKNQIQFSFFYMAI
tara:strand:+ start:3994 stop:4575 length:582 start_codon:yes stop_codon:yes gene_type:complete